MLEPLPSIVICPQKAMTGDVFEVWYLGQSTLKFFERQIQGKVLDRFFGLFKGLQKQADLAEVSS
jgi:hypothetical protein